MDQPGVIKSPRVMNRSHSCGNGAEKLCDLDVILPCDEIT